MHGRGLRCMGDLKLTLQISKELRRGPREVGFVTCHRRGRFGDFRLDWRYFSLSSSSTQRV